MSKQHTAEDEISSWMTVLIFVVAFYYAAKLAFWICKVAFEIIKYLATQLVLLIGIAYWSSVFVFRKYKYRNVPRMSI